MYVSFFFFRVGHCPAYLAIPQLATGVIGQATVESDPWVSDAVSELLH